MRKHWSPPGLKNNEVYQSPEPTGDDPHGGEESLVPATSVLDALVMAWAQAARGHQATVKALATASILDLAHGREYHATRGSEMTGSPHGRVHTDLPFGRAR